MMPMRSQSQSASPRWQVLLEDDFMPMGATKHNSTMMMVVDDVVWSAIFVAVLPGAVHGHIWIWQLQCVLC